MKLRRDLRWESLPLDRFRTEIRWTPRLLVLMDGLDEIHPLSRGDRYAILDGLEKLPDAPWVADWCGNLKAGLETVLSFIDTVAVLRYVSP